MEKFRAYRIFEENGKGRGRLVEMTLDELDAGEVVIRGAYSSVNFKDALTATGAGKIVRRYPCVGGIDSSGTVVTSSDSRFKAGDAGLTPSQYAVPITGSHQRFSCPKSMTKCRPPDTMPMTRRGSSGYNEMPKRRSPEYFGEDFKVTIMTNDIDKLQKEHTDFVKLLDLLEGQIGLFHRGERPDYDLMLDIFYYMTHYPDRFHHPKEDLAFAKMAERDSVIKPAVEELARQHQVIAESGSRFRDNLNAALAGAMLNREAVEVPALEYVTFYRNHMKMEERELFPLARTLLRDVDWASISVAIESTEDPLFGSQVEQRNRSIHQQITRLAQCGCAVD